jgi:hypothetical protein
LSAIVKQGRCQSGGEQPPLLSIARGNCVDISNLS